MLRALPLTLLLAFTLLATGCTGGGTPGPEAKLRVLIVDGHNNHPWKETTPVMKATLENAGIFEVAVATAPPKDRIAEFSPGFADYDVVLMNYNGPEWSDATKASFQEFVSGGGGLVIFHAADNSFPKWPEYNEMIGLGGWGGRDQKDGPYVYYNGQGQVVRDDSDGRGGSHGPQQEFVVRTRTPEHPIMKGLPGQWLHVKDEMYSRLRGPAKNLTILATGQADPDRHEPVLMTIRYGQGRVFHTVLGHAGEQAKGLGFQVTLQRGTEWAATGKVTQPAPRDGLLNTEEAVYCEPHQLQATTGG